MKFLSRAALALTALWAGSPPASAQVQMIIPWRRVPAPTLSGA